MRVFSISARSFNRLYLVLTLFFGICHSPVVAHPDGLKFWLAGYSADSSSTARSSAGSDSTDVTKLALSAENLVLKPNPFSPRDEWGLQFGYTLHSKVSSQVSVRIIVQNQGGDKVYESQETLVKQGVEIKPGQYKADPEASDRRSRLGPFLWDGRNNQRQFCRNGPYLLRLIIRDGQGVKEYQRRVVLIQ